MNGSLMDQCGVFSNPAKTSVLNVLKEACFCLRIHLSEHVLLKDLQLFE